MESREPELSFDTKVDGILGFIVENMGSLISVRIYLTDPVYEPLKIDWAGTCWFIVMIKGQDMI